MGNPAGAAALAISSLDGFLNDGSEEIVDIPLESVLKAKYQPRQTINTATLNDLAETIKAHGVIQPIVVRPCDDQGHYQVIIGERRWRASQVAGCATIPAVVRDYDAPTTLAIQLIENSERDGVPVLEEAAAVAELVRLCEGKQAVAAAQLRRSAAWVSKRLAVNVLPEEIKALAMPQEDGDTEPVCGNMETLAVFARLVKTSQRAATQAAQHITEHRGKVAGGSRHYVEQALNRAQQGHANGGASTSRNATPTSSKPSASGEYSTTPRITSPGVGQYQLEIGGGTYPLTREQLEKLVSDADRFLGR